MTGRLADKVAFITGAARGQGRAHAVRFAEKGADIIAVDICRQLDTVAYPMSCPEDLDETVNLVEKTGRRIVAAQADVRDFARLQEVLADGVAELGRLDFVLANAGVMPGVGLTQPAASAYTEAIDIMLNGVYTTIEAALPHLLRTAAGGAGAAIVITSSTAGFKSLGANFEAHNPGLAGYTAAKHGAIGLMRYYATTLAEKEIRVNSVHPAGVASPMIQNEAAAGFLDEHPAFATLLTNLLPVSLIPIEDVTEAMLYLCAKSGRYITGTTLCVDAGILQK